MMRDFKEPERGKRADDSAERVHQALQAERAAVSLRRNVGREQSLSCGGAHAAAKPGPGAPEKHLISVCGEAERTCTQRGKRVAEYGERFAALQLIRVIACCQLGKTGKTVGDSFDGAEPGGASANCSKKCGKDGGRGFVAPIAEQAGEANAEDGAVEPALFFGGFGHE